MIILNDLKRVRRKTSVNLFFLELIIVLLFLSVSGVVILKLFATANKLEEKSSVTERAMADVQSVAETYSIIHDIRSSVEEVFGENWFTEGADGGLTVCFDELHQPLITDDVRERYGRIKVIFTESREKGKCGEMCRLRARVFLLTDYGKEIYSQTSSVYIPDFAAGGAI